MKREDPKLLQIIELLKLALILQDKEILEHTVESVIEILTEINQ